MFREITWHFARYMSTEHVHDSSEKILFKLFCMSWHSANKIYFGLNNLLHKYL